MCNPAAALPVELPGAASLFATTAWLYRHPPPPWLTAAGRERILAWLPEAKDTIDKTLTFWKREMEEPAILILSGSGRLYDMVDGDAPTASASASAAAAPARASRPPAQPASSG